MSSTSAGSERNLKKLQKEVKKKYNDQLKKSEDLDPVLAWLKEHHDPLKVGRTQKVLESLQWSCDALDTVVDSLKRHEESERIYESALKAHERSGNDRQALVAYEDAKRHKAESKDDVKRAISNFKIHSNRVDVSIKNEFGDREQATVKGDKDAKGQDTALKDFFHRTLIILARPGITSSDVRDLWSCWDSARMVLEKRLDALIAISRKANQEHDKLKQADDDGFNQNRAEEPDLNVINQASSAIDEVRREAGKLQKEKEKVIKDSDKELMKIVKESVEKWKRKYP